MDRSTFEFAHQHSESWIIGGHFKADKCVASGKNYNLHLRGQGHTAALIGHFHLSLCRDGSKRTLQWFTMHVWLHKDKRLVERIDEVHLERIIASICNPLLNFSFTPFSFLSLAFLSLSWLKFCLCSHTMFTHSFYPPKSVSLLCRSVIVLSSLHQNYFSFYL